MDFEGGKWFNVHTSVHLKGWANLTRYEIYMAADELLKIIRRNEGLERAKFPVRDLPHRTLLLSFSNRQPSSHGVNFLCDCVKFDTRDVGAERHGPVVLSYASEDFHFLKKSILDDDWIHGDPLITSDRFTPRRSSSRSRTR
jgi:hypothetical protein